MEATHMSDYAPIRVSTLRGDQKIPFNAYVKVAGKYILLCREGDSFEGSRLERLKGKKIAKMFVPLDQKAAYDAYIRINLDLAYNNTKDKPIEIRTQIIHGALQATADDLIEEPDAKDYYSVALDGARRFIKFFYSDPLVLQHILNLKNDDFSVSHHGVTVAALALAICEDMGLLESRAMQMELLVVGALIHDIEHNYNNLDRSTRPDLYNKVEIKIYERHSIDGHERIKTYQHFDPLVRDIVLNHEEKLGGAGPRKRREKDLDELVMVIAAANIFDHYLTYEQLHPRDALKKYLIEKMGILHLKPMKSLQAALKKRAII
jgi:putative nucleotidyltransferase with HDIG domain